MLQSKSKIGSQRHHDLSLLESLLYCDWKDTSQVVVHWAVYYNVTQVLVPVHVADGTVFSHIYLLQDSIHVKIEEKISRESTACIKSYVRQGQTKTKIWFT